MHEPAEYTIEPSEGRVLDWGELWRYRELFYFFTWRDIKIKYKQATLGFLWAILQPLFMMVIFTLFFGKALNIPSQNLPYPIYVFSGLLIWNLFSTGLTNASNSMVNNASIIKKIYFPRLIIPVSSILVALFDFLMAFILFVPILLFYQQSVSLSALVLWPVALIIAIVATLGLGSWLAALNVKYRDFRYVIPFLIQVLFFLSPVIYPISLLKYPILQYILACSPMLAAVELFRYPLTGIFPDGYFLGISLLSGVVLLAIGVLYFKRAEDFFADFA
ncbi:MAG: ABC transporter permease [Cytophagales bacterium]|jgi:lipopolysaccharide transport system permease protein|nr:ABC transporter permease [Cytophagales bacterium]MCA6368370.1 ABC transporter permease [Cytophagales bacterium]MCA6371449.1 ABC transporter permease [Cytophagales bacterium]MCA6374823.1 ABC transporter permease [Cytophagales bacterium]MCA6385041.1 ABC transporter permease [Cytophagales bacterium]